MYDRAYTDERNHQVQHFEFEVPVGDAWKEMVGLLGEQGFVLSPVVVEGRTVETDWATGPFGDRERILVRVERKSAKHVAIELRHQVEEHVDGGLQLRADPPDLGLEWQLIQRAEPLRAKKIEDDSDAAGKRAGTVGRGCDRGCETGCRTCMTCADACDRCNTAAKKVTPPKPP
jgi:hypothetical protein